MPTSAPFRGARKLPLAAESPLRTRRLLKMMLLFIGSVLLVNALAGDRGLSESFEARRHQERLRHGIDQLRRHNDRLRQEARRLREDPSAIEEVARRELGLIRPGELLFLLSDSPGAR